MMNSQLSRYDNNNYSMAQIIPMSYPGGTTTPTTPTLTAALKSFEDLIDDGTMDPICMSRMEHQHQAKFMPPSVIPKVMVNMAAPLHHHQQQQQQQQEDSMNNNLMSLPLAISSNSSMMGDQPMMEDQPMAGDSDDDSQFSDDSTSTQNRNWASQSAQQMGLESGSASQNSNDSQQTSFEEYSGENNSNSNSGSNKKKSVKKTKSRGSTGRKPRSNEKLTPEEERRRRVRRERNKLAAARCRKRRMDHTNDLLKQTEALEQEKQNLRTELDNLDKRSKELACLLENHLCKFNGSVAKQHHQQQQQQHQQQHHQQQQQACRPRPTSLPLSNIYSNSQPVNPIVTSESSLVPIQTPSHGILLENILEDGTLHTGLTPLTNTGLTPLTNTGLTPLLNTPQGFSSGNPSSCGGQQRSHNNVVGIDLSSPDKGAPPNLVSL